VFSKAAGFIVILTSAALALSGCPANDGAPGATGAASQNASSAQPASQIKVRLVASDLGLGDGSFVRQADSELAELAKQGRVDYQLIGDLPEPLKVEAGARDVGLPHTGSMRPGEMTLAEAEELLAGVDETEWLVLSTWRLLEPALKWINEGKLTADLILVLDDEGRVLPAEAPPVPVYVFSYDIRPAAFICGVAAAESSNTGMFTIMANAADPHAQDFLDAAWTGAKFHTNGAVVADAIMPVEEQTGLVTPEAFRNLHRKLNEEMGPYFLSNHYIMALGRATPSIMHAMTQEPFNGYVVGAYADYRTVRQGRVVGCALKQPGAALAYLFSRLDAGDQLVDIADSTGTINVGIDEDAVGFTAFDLYSRFNPDGEDIAQVVEGYWNEVRVGELDVLGLIEEFRNKEQSGE
jgi:hypothetical protein